MFAFAISLALHGLALMLIGFLFHPSDHSETHATAAVFQLIATTVDQRNFIDDPTTELIAKEAIEKHKTIESPQSTKHSLLDLKDKLLKDDQIDSDREAFHSLQPSSLDAIEKQLALFKLSAFAAQTFSEGTIRLPRYDPATPNLAWPKVLISDQQQQKLKKAIDNLIEQMAEMGHTDTTFYLTIASQVFAIKVHRSVPADPTNLEEAIVDIQTAQNDLQLATQIRLQRLAFSHFAQMVDHWDPQVAIHNDVVEGRFHSNYPFIVSRSAGITPRFYGKVTTAAHDFKANDNFHWVEPGAIFQAGIETGVKPIQFPANSIPSLPQADPHSLLRLSEESWINFQENGSIQYATKSKREGSCRINHLSQIFLIIGENGAKIHVKGTVKGKILVYSKGNIIIDGNLLYARPPERFADSEDLLGLVSDRNVEIAPPAITGPGDLIIYAAIYAKRWFRIPNLSGSANAKLYIYGSLAAGCVSATEPRYATHVCFDRRFESQRPPYFPVTEQFEIAEWSREWKIKPNYP
ncbi:MAG: hypothetical protein ONB13_04010 [candidate division KSB1 bacterium]|nr:hypothetical protein [candidate division KSB1 bacterium]